MKDPKNWNISCSCEAINLKKYDLDFVVVSMEKLGSGITDTAKEE